MPVSYTHLDVYKRQTIDSAAQANDRAVVFFLQADMFAAGEEEATDLTVYLSLIHI